MTWHHPALAPRTINALDDEIAKLRAENVRLRALLARIRQWDHLDGAGDGPFWKREIDAALNQQQAPGTKDG